MSKGKVKVTKAQAEAIDYFKKTFVENRATSMSNEKLVSALNYGYEIIPEFKVGDWVVVTFELHRNIYGKTKKITNVKKSFAAGHDICFELDGKGVVFLNEIRPATPEEIQLEKEHRWWDKHGRGINEYKKGDVVSTGSITRTINYLFENGELGLEGVDYGYEPHELILVCSVENRLDTP